MDRPGRARSRLIAIAAAALLLIPACAQTVSGTGTTGGASTRTGGSTGSTLPPVTAPDAQLTVVGDSGSAFDTTTKNALSDVMAFWQQQYPSVSDGKPLPVLRGGLYSVDGTQVWNTKQVTGPAAQEGCVKRDPAFIVDNAAYCSLDDSIIWDRAPRHLLAALAAKYGSLLVALIFAHEFGHAIQYRLNVDPHNVVKTISTESQADCASGAFIASAMAGQAPHFRPSTADLESALTGFLLFRDSTPDSPADVSHGNGFDRLSSFDNGIRNGVKYCFAPTYLSTRTFTERPYVIQSDYVAGGNEPLAQVINPSATAQGGGGLQPDLNRFWTAAAKSLGKTWADVKIAEAEHPKCGSASPASEFGYCPDDNTVYYSKAFAASAYYSLDEIQIDRSTADVTLNEKQPADFALGTLFAIGWGLAVRHQLFSQPINDQNALLAAVCYTGAYAKDINRADGDATHQFTLSPPDMDEATSAMLNLVGKDQAYGARDTSGLQRIQKFVGGYSGGLSLC